MTHIDPQELKELLKLVVSENIKESKDIALLFSGGTDSLSILFTLLDLGIKPTLYTFRLSEYESEDWKISHKIAKELKLKIIDVIIPYNKHQIINDITKIIKKFKTRRKTIIECAYPFLSIAPLIKEKFVLTGLSADSNYGTSASMSIKYSKNPEGFNMARKKLFANSETDGYKAINDIIESFNHKLIVPYRDTRLINYFLQYNWQDLNKPKQKWFIVKIWNKKFENLMCYRKNNNLQVGSKIRERMISILPNETSIIKYYGRVLKAVC